MKCIAIVSYDDAWIGEDEKELLKTENICEISRHFYIEKLISPDFTASEIDTIINCIKKKYIKENGYNDSESYIYTYVTVNINERAK